LIGPDNLALPIFALPTLPMSTWHSGGTSSQNSPLAGLAFYVLVDVDVRNS
jgi:hypothetical protein